MIIQLEISSQAFKYDFTQIDCFDLTIGNMLSFYDPELFDLYCAYCSIYCNHSKAKDYNRIISFNFGYNFLSAYSIFDILLLKSYLTTSASYFLAALNASSKVFGSI